MGEDQGVRVSFRVHQRGGPDVNEPTAAALRAMRSALYGDPAYGVVQISAQGQPAVEVDDELWWIVMHLCYHAAAEIAEGRSCVVPLYRDVGSVALEPNGGSVRVIPEGGSPLEAPCGELVAALVACGDRFLSMLRTSGDPTLEGPVAELLEARGAVAHLSAASDQRPSDGEAPLLDELDVRIERPSTSDAAPVARALSEQIAALTGSRPRWGLHREGDVLTVRISTPYAAWLRAQTRDGGGLAELERRWAALQDQIAELAARHSVTVTVHASGRPVASAQDLLETLNPSRR